MKNTTTAAAATLSLLLRHGGCCVFLSPSLRFLLSQARFILLLLTDECSLQLQQRERVELAWVVGEESSLALHQQVDLYVPAVL